MRIVHCYRLCPSDRMADLMLRLVDLALWHSLLERSESVLIHDFESGDGRDERPEPDERLGVAFDVDVEGDFLEWFDRANLGPVASNHMDGKPEEKADVEEQQFAVKEGEGSAVQQLVVNTPSLLESIQTAWRAKELNDAEACEPLLILADWASIGYWTTWEARGLLYIEPLLNKTLQNSEELYDAVIWTEIGTVLSKLDELGYTESVVLDWMQRRDNLGETLEAADDPRIVPTMAAHERAASTLHYAMNSLRHSKELIAIVGREYDSSNHFLPNGQRLIDIVRDGFMEENQ
jgi:hypothetical protein